MTDFVDPRSILSEEALGAPTILVVSTASSVSSAESLGSPSVGLSMSPASIASEESLGTPSLAILISPSSILSEEYLPPPVTYVGPFAVTSIPISRLSGELTSTLLGNTAGNIFISPSFEVPNPSNVLDVDSVTSSTNYGDTYVGDKKPAIVQRPFVFGPQNVTGRIYPPEFNPGTNYIPKFNTGYKFIGTNQTNVSGVLNAGGPDIYIFY